VHRSAGAQQAEAGGTAGPTPAGAGNDNVVDADFEEVDDRQRKRG
jgi:hypothetical protein